MIPLNEFGKAVWRNKINKNLFAQRDYEWCDRIIVINESNGREIIEDTEFSTFDFSDWVPVTFEEFSKVKRKYNEIYLSP